MRHTWRHVHQSTLQVPAREGREAPPRQGRGAPAIITARKGQALARVAPTRQGCGALTPMTATAREGHTLTRVSPARQGRAPPTWKGRLSTPGEVLLSRTSPPTNSVLSSSWSSRRSSALPFRSNAPASAPAGPSPPPGPYLPELFRPDRPHGGNRPEQCGFRTGPTALVSPLPASRAQGMGRRLRTRRVTPRRRRSGGRRP